MRICSDTPFQLSFPYPEDNSIKDYLSLKEFDHGTASWAYYEDTINFASLSSSSSSENTDTFLQNKIHFLSSSDFTKKNKASSSIISSSTIKETVDNRTLRRDKGSIIYLAEVSQKKNKQDRQKITDLKKYKSSDVVSAGLEKNSSLYLGAVFEYPKKK
ncbi:MAG: hypothetical protein ACKOW3_01530 [Hyphomicrobium sp.]